MPEISIGPVLANQNEGSGGGVTNFTFAVTRNGDLTQESRVQYSLVYGTAASSDFSGINNGIITFAPNVDRLTITIPVVADNVNENDETFSVRLQNPTNATINPNAATANGTIRNDDSPAGPSTVRITTVDPGSASKNEGSTGGTTEFTFKVIREGDKSLPSTVGWAIDFGNGATSSDASDFVSTSGNVSFTAGQTEQILTVQVRADTVPENNEFFFVKLTSATNATVDQFNNSAGGFIQNDDVTATAPVISIIADDLDNPEGTGPGTSPFTFTLKRNGDLTAQSTVNYIVEGTGSSPADPYVDLSNGLPTAVTFAPGEDSKTITLLASRDAANEPDETFRVRIYSPTNGTLNPNQTTVAGTIRNDDAAALPVLGITATDANRNEGSTGGTTDFTFTVTRTGDTSVASTATWGVYQTDAPPLVDGDDFSGLIEGQVSWAAGETGSKTITVKVSADTDIEPTESFVVVLESATGATINPNQAEAVGTIINDDSAAPPVLGIVAASANKNEGSTGGTTPFTFTVTRNGDTSVASSAKWDVYSNGTPAVTTGDFVGSLTGQVSWNAGETGSKTITVFVNADTAPEQNESFRVELSNATGATINPNQTSAVGTIINDDTQPATQPDLDVTGIAVTRGTFTVGNSTAIGYRLVNSGTAEAGPSKVGFYRSADTVFDPASDTLLFTQDVGAMAAGAVFNGGAVYTPTTAGNYFLIAVADSGQVINNEISETNNPSNAVGLVVQPLPSVGITTATVSQNEGSTGGTTPFTFTVTRNGSTTDASTVGWQLFSVTGVPTIDVNDYTNPVNGTVTFQPGQTSQTITVNIRADTGVEQNETFKVKLQNVTGATIDPGKTEATGVIVNDDSRPARPEHDLNGDGRSDILWRHESGQISLWTMNGESVLKTSDLGNVSLIWTIQDAADFNGDGKADILWQNSSGGTALWLMNGDQVLGTPGFAGPGAGWRVQDAADLSGDGKADIVFRHDDGRVSIWTMDGATPLTKTNYAAVSSDWTIRDAADFSGDGKADILWQNANGNASIWVMNGGQVTSTPNFAGPGAGWTIQDAADFSGDGRADILWRHTDGRLSFWTMNGSTLQTRTDYGAVSNAWKVEEAADYSGDGRADVLWRNANGQTSLWEMNGGQVADNNLIPAVPVAWQIVNHDFA